MREIVHLVEDNSLKTTPAGCEIGLRLKWYRSLPVSCIEKLEVSLDGKPVDPAEIRLGVNGHQFRLEELAGLVEEFWFIQDSAILSVSQANKWKVGETHKINVELAVRFPYIPIGRGVFLTHVHNYSTEQVVH
jgi:Domain of unknown function (DUF6379)